MRLLYIIAMVISCAVKSVASTPSRPNIVIAIIGDKGVGKSTLIEKFTKKDRPNIDYASLDKFPEFILFDSNFPKAKFKLWEFSGSRNRSSFNKLVKGVDGFIVIYEAGNQDSFDRTHGDFRDLFEDDAPLTLLANHKENKIPDQQVENNLFEFHEHLSIKNASDKQIKRIFEEIFNRIIMNRNFAERSLARSYSFSLNQSSLNDHKRKSCCFKGESAFEDEEITHYECTSTFLFSSAQD